MNKWYLTAIIIFILSFETQAGKGEKVPLDIQVYLSILAKKGNLLTDYEKDYMKRLGHGDIKEDHPINATAFHNAFVNELERESQAMKYYQQGRDELDTEKSATEK